MRNVVAREIMTSPVITTGPDAPIHDLTALLLKHRISGLPVVDGAGRILGIVTERDLLEKGERPYVLSLIQWYGRPGDLARQGERFLEAVATTARDVMTAQVITASEDTPVRDLARLMLTHAIKRIPIVREERVVGIVARADILRAFMRSDEDLEAAIQETLVRDFMLDPAGFTIACSGGVVTIIGEIEHRTDRELLIKALQGIDGVAGVDASRLTYRSP